MDIYNNFTTPNSTNESPFNEKKNKIIIIILLIIISIAICVILSFCCYILFMEIKDLCFRRNRITKIYQYISNKTFNNLYSVRGPTDDICSICLESNDKIDTVVLKCDHIFHKTCIDKWFTNRTIDNNNLVCPLCRDINDNL